MKVEKELTEQQIMKLTRRSYRFERCVVYGNPVRFFMWVNKFYKPT